MNAPHNGPPPPQHPSRRPANRWIPGGSWGELWTILVESRAVFLIGFIGLWLLINSLLWMVQNLVLPSYLLVRALDVATGAAALPGAPWVMWALWGGVFGSALGNWLLAPLYGGREMRAMPLLLSVLAMLLLAALLWAFVR